MTFVNDSGAALELKVDSMAVGGDGVGRDATGRVVFATGALPGERVRVEIQSEHKRFARGAAIEVIEASPDRIEPLCPHVSAGCGGCGFAHVSLSAQRDLKIAMIVEALERIGRIEAPLVRPGPALDPQGFRTTVRAAVTNGRGGYRMAHGHKRIEVDSCRVAHPLVEEMLVDGYFADADEATLRVGANTGERLALLSPTAVDVVLPSDVMVVGSDELRAGKRAWIHEEIRGLRLRVSAESFFQSRPDGAVALVDAVAEAIAGVDPAAPLVDLYCGVGLFAATVGRGRPVVAVERSRSSVADAKVNLANQNARVVPSAVERWRHSAATVVVADPPRNGLGKAGVAKVGATGAECLALVSCDAGALGRDARLLTEAGWRFEGATLIDLFTDTPHVEVVSRFIR